MKKISLKAAVVLLAGSFLCSSCIGSFSLFNKYEKWQCSMTGNKYVNGIVGLILQPIVGTICLVVDAVVLNTIEFWSGDNPMQANTIQQVKGEDGRNYTVKVVKDGYVVTAEDGEVTLFNHDAKTDTWSITQNGITKDIVRYNNNGTVVAYLQSGETLTVSNDQAGVEMVREAVLADSWYAMK